MAKAAFRELLRRYSDNPIITPHSLPYPANTVFNAGATLMPDGETVLLARVEDRRGISHLTVARSPDGIRNWSIDDKPTLLPDPINHPEETWGIEDPRITWIEEDQRFAVVYTAFSTSGPLVALAFTRDFKEYERRGPMMPPSDKDAALFPRRFDGRWLLLHRPTPTEAGERANMWLSFSPDLRHWGDHQVVIPARRGAWWDADKIGLSPPPIETSSGWLIIYHGVRRTASGSLYRIGLALLDLEDPRRLITRGDEWIFGPETQYEYSGDVGGVVFPCGTTYDKSTDELRLYYGAADSCIALATGKVADMLEWLKNNGNNG